MAILIYIKKAVGSAFNPHKLGLARLGALPDFWLSLFRVKH